MKSKICDCRCHRWDNEEIFTEDVLCCEWSGEKFIRPWGRYEILWDGDDCKVKRITVNPGKKLSYQYHQKRAEDWIIIKGDPIITMDDRTYPLPSGNKLHIARGVKHRIENQSDESIVFIEVQTGSYLGEDDIVRLEDDYGRT